MQCLPKRTEGNGATRADSSGNVENEDDLKDQSEEPIPLPSSISSLDDLAPVSTYPSSSGNQSNGELVTTPVTTVSNGTNQLKPNNVTHDNSGRHEITYGKWVGLTNGKSRSFMPMKGDLNYGGKMYNEDRTRFPQRNYGTWKGSPYTGISNTEADNYGKMFGNTYPMNNFRGMLFHGVQFESISPTMRGDTYSVDDSRGYPFRSFDSEIPFTQEYSLGKWIPMHRSGANKLLGETFGNGKPMMYRHIFGNTYPMHTSMQPSSNNFEYGTSGNLKAYNYGGHDFGMSYGEHFPASSWK
ncbi:hypothetical protein AVEN_107929-1 [Araneus ventricosus]|uniref:Uncharacterized protein n=1 Tax=Araneus ventricosus TaxID=182803 RepID=A0A4Y2L023_ARAVE|nr:hypothetical protein AVEN_107929-1 [Araneus ventricosus]